MAAGRYVGRVGALAVALGIGAAVTQSPGTAFAEQDSSTSNTSASGSAADSSPSASAPGTTSTTDPQPEAGSADDGEPASGEPDAPSNTVTVDSGPTVVVGNSRGGEPSSAPSEESEEDSASRQDGGDSSDDSTAGAESDEGEDADEDETPVAPATAGQQEGSDRAGARLTAFQKDLGSDDQPTTQAIVDRSQTLPAEPPSEAVQDTLRLARTAATTMTTPVGVAETASTPQRFNGILAPLNIVVDAVSGILARFTLPADTPTDTPLIWGLLAWVRREIERTFFNKTPTLNPLTTGQNVDGTVVGRLDFDDAEDDPLTFEVVGEPAHGSVVVNPDGTYVYTPDTDYAHTPGEVLTDKFTVRVSDNGFNPFDLSTYPLLSRDFRVHGPLFFLKPDWGNSTSQEVTVSFKPLNRAPVAVDNSYEVDEDTPLTITAPGLLANDTDPDGDAVTVISWFTPDDGTLTVNQDGSFTYTPDAGFYGTDSFGYRVTDGFASDNNGVSNLATVTITVNPVNDTPVANADGYTTPEDTPLTVNAPGVLGNDTDDDGDTLTAQLVSGAAHGMVTQNSDGSFTYVPATDYHGADSFTYRVADGSSTSSAVTVSITVTPVNDAPVARPDGYTTAEDTQLTITAPGVLGNDTDADGDGLSMQLVSNAAHGVVTHNPDGSFTYVPAADYNGPDSFTYQASDGKTTSNVVTVDVTVTPVDDAPPNHAPVIAEVSVGDPNLTTGVVLGSVTASDEDGDTLQYSSDLSPTAGTLEFDEFGGFVFTPSQAARDLAATTELRDLLAVVITVSDGELSDTHDINVELAPTPAPSAIPVGGPVADLIISGDRAYALDFENDTVAVIDTHTNQVVDSYDVAETASRLVVSGSTLYVMNSDVSGASNSVSAIDTATGQSTTIPIPVLPGSDPSGGVSPNWVNAIVASPTGDRLYVFATDGNMYVVDTDDPPIGSYHSVVATVPVGGQTEVIASPDGHLLYGVFTPFSFGSVGDVDVRVIDTQTLPSAIELVRGVPPEWDRFSAVWDPNSTTNLMADHLSGLASSPDGSRLYVLASILEVERADSLFDVVDPHGVTWRITDSFVAVSVIDTTPGSATYHSVVDVVMLPSFGADLAVDDTYVYVSGSDGNVTVIDRATNAIVQTIVTDANFAQRVTVSDGTIYIVDGDTVYTHPTGA